MRSRSSNYKGCACPTTHDPLLLLMYRNTDVLMYWYTAALGIELTLTWLISKAVKQNLSENTSADSFLQEHTTVHCGGPWEKKFAHPEKEVFAMPFTAQWWCCHHPPINGAQDLHENLHYIGDAAFLGYQTQWTELSKMHGHNNNDHPLLNFPNTTHQFIIFMSADIIDTIYQKGCIQIWSCEFYSGCSIPRTDSGDHPFRVNWKKSRKTLSSNRWGLFAWHSRFTAKHLSLGQKESRPSTKAREC